MPCPCNWVVQISATSARDHWLNATLAQFARRSNRGGDTWAETVDLGAQRDSESLERGASAAAESFPNIPGFEILSEVGRGGMGVVYKARQTGLNRICAVKIALPATHASALARARFLAEAETIARLKHANLVQIYSLGERDGCAYYEMEYIEGGSLAGRLDGTPWEPKRAARLVSVLARAIGEAHRLGIVHRDLKPANVLLTAGETPKVVDFGLAKWLEADTHLTQSGVFIGTPSYAAPEQVAGWSAAVGPPADIYALGAIFYQMLTGRPPFHGPTVLRTMEQVTSADPVPPSRLQPGLPRDVETIALKWLEKDPRRRYADTAALAEDLDRYLAGLPILARPSGMPERLRKWARRQPAVAALSAAVVAVTVLGFILVGWQWQRAEAKAAAAAAANRAAQRARRDVVEEEAKLTFKEALALCDQGEVARGLVWLTRSLELAAEAQSGRLDRPIRINLADWASQLIRPLKLPPLQQSGPEKIGSLPAIDDGVRAAIRDLKRRQQLASAQKALESELGEGSAVEVTASTPSGRTVIRALRGGGLHVWLEAMERRFDLPPQGTEVTSLAISPDCRVFASGTKGGVVRLWDTSLLGQIGQTSEIASAATALAFDPHGTSLAISDEDGTVRLVKLPCQKALGFPVQIDKPVQSLTFDRSGKRVLIGTSVGARWWDLSRPVRRESCPRLRRPDGLAIEPGGGDDLQSR